MGNTINLAFTSDEHYFAQLAAVILSVKEHMKERDVQIYVLTDAKNRSSVCVERIEALQEERLKITFLYIEEEAFVRYALAKPGSHLTLATVYRLLLGELLPKEVEKLLFLDTDMLICGDLYELYMEDVENVVMGAVVEGAKEDALFLKKTLYYMFDYYESEAEAYRSYFNAGVLLINMTAFREQQIGHRCLQLLTEHPEFVCYDQDALNIVCKGKIKYLAPKWNRIWRREPADGSPGTGCLAQDMDDVRIIHYCTSQKPWTDPEYKLTDLFMRTLYNTQWYPQVIGELKATTIARVFIYRFPWKEVAAGEKIFIYGGGEVGEKQAHQMKLTGYADVCAVIDKNAQQIGSLWGIPAIRPDEFKDRYQGEKIVIGILKESVRLEIRDSLRGLGIPEEKIIWDYEAE